MITFEKSFADYQSAPDTGGKKAPYLGGHKCFIRNVKVTTTKEHSKPMVVFFVDIGEGQFAGYFKDRPLRYHCVIDNDRGKQRFSKIVRAISVSNPGFISDADMQNSSFDESRLNGLAVGCIIGQNDKGFLNADDLLSVEDALKVGKLADPVFQKKPAISTPTTTPASDDCPF